MTQWRLAAGDTPGHLDIVTVLGEQVAQDLAVDVAIALATAHNNGGDRAVDGGRQADRLARLMIGRSTF